MDIVNRTPLTYGRLVQHAFWIRFLRDYGYGQHAFPEQLGPPLEGLLNTAYELGSGLEAEAEEARQRFNNQAPGAVGVVEIVEALKQRANQIVDGLYERIVFLDQPQPEVGNRNRRRLGYLTKLQNILSLRYFQWLDEGENRRLSIQDLFSIARRAPDGVRRVVMDLAERRRWRAQQNPDQPRRGNPVAVVEERINATAVYIFDSFEFVIRENRLERARLRNAALEARREHMRQAQQLAGLLMEREAGRLAEFAEVPVAPIPVREPGPGILRRRPEDLIVEQEAPEDEAPEEEEAPEENPLGHEIVRPEPIRGVPPIVHAIAPPNWGQVEHIRNWFNGLHRGFEEMRALEDGKELVQELQRLIRETEARLNGTREEFLEQRTQLCQKIDELKTLARRPNQPVNPALYFERIIHEHQNKLNQLDKLFERKYPPTPIIEEGAFPICLKKCYRLLCKFREINLQEQLENEARGLPPQFIFEFNPLEVFHTMMKLFESAETTKNLEIEKFFDDVQKMADKADEQPVEPPAKPYRFPGQFQLPSHIRERLSVQEVQVIENSMDHLRKDMVEGKRLSHIHTSTRLIREFQWVIDNARRDRQSDELLPEGRLIEAVEGSVQADDFGRREEVYQDSLLERRRRAPTGIQPSKVFRLPESRHLYTPYISKMDYDLWTERDVHDWIRHFVHDQKHRDLIDVRRFDGPCLFSFLDSNTEWKEAGWPFGLFVRVKGHFNRVVNGENPHFQCMRIDDF